MNVNMGRVKENNEKRSNTGESDKMAYRIFRFSEILLA